MQFFFIIKDSRYNNFNKLASAFFLINALLFLFIGFQSQTISKRALLFSAAALSAIYAIYNWKYRRRKEKSFIALYLFTIVVWIATTSAWLAAFVLLVLLIIHLRFETVPFVQVSKDGITINSFSRSTSEWKKISNCIMKDGLLTIDFTNNKILQAEPDWTNTNLKKEYKALEQEFNEFCRQQLIS